MLTDGKAEHDEAAMWRCAPTDANMEFLPCSARSAVQAIIFKYLRPQCYLYSLELPVGYFHRVPFLAVGKSEKQIYSTFAFPLRAPECASLSPICAWNWCRRCPTFGSTCPGIASTLSSVTHTFMSSDSPQQKTLFLCLSLPDKILGLIVLKCEQLKTSKSML